MNYLEFIARVTAHIPDKGQVMVRSGNSARSEKANSYINENPPFWGVRLISLPTGMTMDNGDFLFGISHRMYPAVRSGYESFWGLDGPAVALLSFGYGITDRLGVTFARSGRFQDVEISSSWLVLQPGENASLPFSASVNGGIIWITEKQADRGLFNSRNFKINAQFVLSHQFSRRISVLVMPAYSSNVNHWKADPEGTFALGLGGRFMVIEDLFLIANSIGMTSDQFIGGGDYRLSKGDFRIGFSIFRTF